jgi:uncharacterized membrane protein YesL
LKTHFEKTKQVQQKGLSPFYSETLALIHLNLTWFVMSLPGITLFPALGGLYSTIAERNHNKQKDWQEMWHGFKKFGAISLLWGVLVTLGFVILGVSLWFFHTLDGILAGFVRMLIITALMMWAAINQFSLPLLLHQEERQVLLAIRNGYVICLRRPLTALKVTVTSLFITVISILLPPLWVFISVALIAQNQTHTMLDAVKEIRRKDAARDAIKAYRESKEQIEKNNL